MNENIRQNYSDKLNIEMFYDLYQLSIVNIILSYLCYIQTKKNDDIRFETILSHFIQYIVDNHDFEGISKKVIEIDEKRKLLTVVLLDLKTLYITTSTLIRLLELELEVVKGYVDMFLYFDNYATEFNIENITKSQDRNNMSEIHSIRIYVRPENISSRSKSEIKDYITNIGKRLNLNFNVVIVAS